MLGPTGRKPVGRNSNPRPNYRLQGIWVGYQARRLSVCDNLAPTSARKFLKRYVPGGLLWRRKLTLQGSDALFYERPQAGVELERLDEIVLCFASFPLHQPG